MKLLTWMQSKDACGEARAWVGDRTPAKAWTDCGRGDWMLWCLGHTSIDKREIVRIACDIALSVLPLCDDPRAAAAIDAAEGWCEGTVTAEQCRSAANAVYYAASAYDAVYSAAAAANTVYYAASAYDAVYSAAASASAASAAWRQVRAEVQKEIADLVRARVDARRFSELVTKGRATRQPRRG